ncbi:MAG: histidine kinase [Myxococcota bacterium]
MFNFIEHSTSGRLPSVNGPHAGGPSPWQFWTPQLAGWAVTHWAYFGDRVFLALATKVMTVGEVLWVTMVSLGSTVVVSTALAALFARSATRRSEQRPGFWLRRIPLPTLAASLVCATAVLVCFEVLGVIGRYGVGTRTGTAVMLTTDYAMLMSVWSGLYVLVALYERLRWARERSLLMEGLAHRSQLEALRSRINPHFLFNSLNSVIGLVPRNPDHARQMLWDLSDLLRRSLASVRHEASTLDEELQFLESYLRCERIRFRGRLAYRVHAAAEDRSLSVPSMLLQPLVENAVKHGMVDAQLLEIEVIGRRKNEGFRLEVRNSGTLVPSPVRAPESGNGLELVRKCIAALYPETGRFALFEDEGWVVARVDYDPAERVRPA